MNKLAAFAGLILLSSASALHAGAVFLTGHDPDFHAQLSVGARNLLRVGLDFATGGNFDDATRKFLWIESRPASVPGGHLRGEDGLGAIGLTLGVHYDRANAAELASIDLSQYEAIAVASTFGGLLSQAELDMLFARRVDVAAFVNAGGGIFAAAECDDSPSCQGDLVSNPASVFAWLPVVVSSVTASPQFTVTAFGQSLGLTNADVNDPTHNSFGATGGLNVVDRDANNVPTTLAGIVNITGGSFVPVPEPGSLALFSSGILSLMLLGLRRRRATIAL